MDPPGVVYAGRNVRPKRVLSLYRAWLAIVLVGTGTVALLQLRAAMSVTDTTRSGTVDLPDKQPVPANEIAPAEAAGGAPSNAGQVPNSTVGAVVTGSPAVAAAGGGDGKERDANGPRMTSDQKPAAPRVDRSEAPANDAVKSDVADTELPASRARSKSRKASNKGTEPSAVARERSNVAMPAAMDGLADLNSTEYASATPVYWRVPKAGGTTAQAILAQCLGLVVASETGPVIEARRRNETGGSPRGPPDGLRVVRAGEQRFVNVDVTTKRGILEAKGLGPMDSGLVDVALAPEIMPFVTHLLDDSRGVRGRAFALFRHPVERFTSMFYYIQTVSGSLFQRRGEFFPRRKLISCLSAPPHRRTGSRPTVPTWRTTR